MFQLIQYVNQELKQLFVQNDIIVCGVTMGEYALIGSGAVITKDVPPYALVVSNPGRVVGKVDKKGNRVE